MTEMVRIQVPPGELCQSGEINLSCLFFYSKALQVLIFHNGYGIFFSVKIHIWQLVRKLMTGEFLLWASSIFTQKSSFTIINSILLTRKNLS